MKKAINAILSVFLLAGAVNTSSITASVNAEETDEPVTETAETVEEAPETEEETPEEAPAETEEPEEPAEPAETEAPEEPEAPETTEEPEATPETTEEPEIIEEETEETVEDDEPEAEETEEEGEEEYELFADTGDYALKIYPNGGTWNPVSGYESRLNKGAELFGNLFGNPVSPAQILNGMNLTRDGYHILGFGTSKDAKTAKYELNTKYEYTTKRGAQISLYVIWEADTQEILLDAEGGWFETKDGKVDLLTLKKPVPTAWAVNHAPVRPNYKFLGWTTVNHGTEVEFENTKKYKTFSEDDPVLLHAVWTPVTYKVTLKPNSGIVAGDTKTKKSVTKTYSEEDKSLDLTAAGISRKGYTFKGWFKDSKFKNEITSVDQLLETKGKTATLYAKWEAKTYDVTLALTPYLDVTFKDNTTTASFTHTTGKEKAIKMAPVFHKADEKAEWKFTGWSTEEDADKPMFKDASKYKLFSEDGDAVTLYAVFEPVDFKVTLKANGGIVNGETKTKKSVTKTYNVGKSLDLTESGVRRDGYIFDGWYKEAKFKNKVDYYTLFSSKGKIKTLYAKWTPKTYTVTILANNPDAYFDTVTANSAYIDRIPAEMQTRSVTLTYGKSAVLPSPKLLAGYYTFAGYSDDPNAAAATFKKGTKYSAFSKTGDDITLYAVWTPMNFKVTLKPQGGILTGDTKARDSVSKSYSPVNIPDFSEAGVHRDGYIFDGWYTSTKYTKKVTTLVELVESGAKTLYAKWTPKTYTVTVYANDVYAYYTTPTANSAYSDAPSAEMQVREIKVTFGKEAVLPSPVCFNRTFLGYAEAKDATAVKFKKGAKYKSFSPTGDDITLYAVWK